MVTFIHRKARLMGVITPVPTARVSADSVSNSASDQSLISVAGIFTATPLTAESHNP
ncbi:hypothetical protein DSO57_1020492 [Entomophthora muscae]|uniref:Uncharacterized protein n=2 Tax=Entomophthora muscae TaxID=34485 RepID=A0ACC2UPJ7_9FUNG|nr:hypothetical protein DSO57_1038827 [Entomophthora muscae]KAJ9088707.1 hypothetical protein DSO57_1020492 [Entomophthora muscae]